MASLTVAFDSVPFFFSFSFFAALFWIAVDSLSAPSYCMEGRQSRHCYRNDFEGLILFMFLIWRAPSFLRDRLFFGGHPSKGHRHPPWLSLSVVFLQRPTFFCKRFRLSKVLPDRNHSDCTCYSLSDFCIFLFQGERSSALADVRLSCKYDRAMWS